jgi:hypothetical protein
VTCEWRSAIQVKIQLEYVHARFPKNAELTIQCVTCHNLANRLLTQMTQAGDACHLKVRSGWCDVRIESRGGCCYQIDGHKSAWLFRLCSGYVTRDAIDQRFARGCVI